MPEGPPRPHAKPTSPRGAKRDAAAGNAASRGEAGGEGAGEGDSPPASGSKRRKVRTRQCFHCFTPCTILHRVRVAQGGPWVSVCDICWGHRCEGNPHYAYGGLWLSGRLSQPGEQKATRPIASKRAPRKRTGKKGSRVTGTPPSSSSTSSTSGGSGSSTPSAPA